MHHKIQHNWLQISNKHTNKSKNDVNIKVTVVDSKFYKVAYTKVYGVDGTYFIQYTLSR